MKFVPAVARLFCLALPVSFLNVLRTLYRLRRLCKLQIINFYLRLARTVEYDILGSHPQREGVEGLGDGGPLAAEPLLLRGLHYAPARFDILSTVTFLH